MIKTVHVIAACSVTLALEQNADLGCDLLVLRDQLASDKAEDIWCFHSASSAHHGAPGYMGNVQIGAHELGRSCVFTAFHSSGDPTQPADVFVPLKLSEGVPASKLVEQPLSLFPVPHIRPAEMNHV